ncbi:hypothetical protein B0H19DRAFT_1272001 [Mycena capillaripes]|nr:hypothetical protein B0H19DRAFT_1272001 [Mycena capillaripes]
MSKRTHYQFIDDRAESDPRGDDSTDEDDESTDALLRREDRKRYNMPAIEAGHVARLRTAAPYRIPTEFLEGGGAATPACNDNEFPDMPSRATSPVAAWNHARLHRHSRGPTPYVDPNYNFFPNPDSRGPTPFSFRGETPAYQSPSHQDTERIHLPPLNLSNSEGERAPVSLPPFSALLGQMQQQAGALQQPLQETSPDTPPTSSQHPAKRRRVVREKVSRHIRAFLDLAAEEEDEEGEQRKNDDDDEDSEGRLSDIGALSLVFFRLYMLTGASKFLDDAEQHDEPIHSRPHLLHNAHDAQNHRNLQALAAHYQRASAQYARDAARENAKYGPHRGRLAFVLGPKKLYIAVHLPSIAATTSQWQPAPTSKFEEIDVSKEMTRDKYPSVPPTADDLAPYLNSPHAALLKKTWTGSAPALAEGNRVVVVDGSHKDETGVIVVLRDLGNCSWAKILPQYDGIAPVKKTDKGIYVKLAYLQRHGLDAPYEMRVHDHVRVVSGPLYCGVSGEVSEIADDVLTIEIPNDISVLSDTTPNPRFPDRKVFKVNVRNLGRTFEVGDIVRVRRRRGEGRVGMIVAWHVGGSVELVVRELVRKSSVHLIVLSADVDFAERPSWLAAGEIVAVEHPARLVPQIEAAKQWHTAKVQHRAATNGGSLEELKARREAVEKRLMSTGRRYKDIPVLVGGATFHKGFRGTVTADHDSAEHAARLATERTTGIVSNMDQDRIVITVKNLAGQTVQIDLKHLWHELSHQKLAKAVLIFTRDQLVGKAELPEHYRPKNGLEDASKARACTPPPLDEEGEPSWGMPAVVPELDLPADLPEPQLEGEISGKWMCIIVLTFKRVDVRVVGVRSFPGRLSDTIVSLEGRTGYLIQAAPITDADKKLTIYGLGINWTKHNIPFSCIKPRRENDNGEKLTEIEERVIVIGPDVRGDLHFQGRYGETRPYLQPPGSPKNLVGVVMEDGSPALFHISSLCMAINVTTPSPHGGCISATVFKQ